MNIIETNIPGVVILEPRRFEDERGWFFESYSQRWFAENVCDTVFVQDNESRSRQHVIRGLHYQLPPMAQSKLVRVISGTILDVAIDIRRGSPTFGQHVAVELSGENFQQLFIPRGFAHGFAVLSKETVVQYKCDNLYSPEHEASIFHDDPALHINWLVEPRKVIQSLKDNDAQRFADAPLFDYGQNLYAR
ncbi:dTDP-4-dehydrorhamnose 3,5-epimerase [Alistipes sp. OttesenSCG-928-L06]|nr:dTDP-4-dehydrorhamnose 3,5-epimerase [Alistipes sp. OttesenSCG-928-L06]